MKAIILSGGKGTRLAPLTDKKPKPLVCVGDEPVIKILLRQLKKHNITDVAITISYRGEDIKNALGSSFEGVNITYFEEREPLGTAGGVKNCESFIDSDFLVLSGDALTELDFEKLLESHRKSGALATLTLSCEEDVLEYGVVLRDEHGFVKGFVEKPSAEGIKSDLVNSGIYLFKKEILDYIPKGEVYDFSNDLFVRLLEDKQPINTFLNEGFWCDIGGAFALYSCNMKTLDQSFFVPFIQKDVSVHSDAVVKSSVIGAGTRISSFAEVKRAVVGRECEIGEGAEIIGCILGDRVKIEEGVRVERGAVIGDDCVISKGRLVGEGKKLSADTKLEKSEDKISFGKGSFIWKSGVMVFDPDTPDSFFTLGRAVAARHSKIGIFYEDSQQLYILATVFALGVSLGGAEAQIFGEGDLKNAEFASGAFNIPVFSFFEKKGKLCVYPFECGSLPFSRKKERELVSLFERPPERKNFGTISYFDGADLLEKNYFASLFSDISIPDSVWINILDKKKRRADIKIYVSDNKDDIRLEADGLCLDKEHLEALIIKELVREGRQIFLLPSKIPFAFEALTENSGAKIIKISKNRDLSTLSGMAFRDIWARNTYFALPYILKILKRLDFSTCRLKEEAKKLPDFLCEERELVLKGSSVGRIMRLLQEKNECIPCQEGVEYNKGKGRVRITPDGINKFKIFSEAVSAETARELCDSVEKLISQLE